MHHSQQLQPQETDSRLAHTDRGRENPRLTFCTVESSGPNWADTDMIHDVYGCISDSGTQERTGAFVHTHGIIVEVTTSIGSQSRASHVTLITHVTAFCETHITKKEGL